MSTADAAERLMAAHSEVNRACDLLIAPSSEALDGCQTALQQAVADLTEFRSACRELPAGADARQKAQRLRSEVFRAARLLQSLARFYEGWERILGAMTAGYTATGDPAPVRRQGQLNCRG